MKYSEVVEQTEKYLSIIPEELQGDNENDLVSLLRRNYILLKRYREGLKRVASSEAFDVARSIDKDRDAELIVRMEYAKQILGETE